MKSPKRGRRPPQQRPQKPKPPPARPPAAREPAPARPAGPVEPLRPRRRLFYILLALVGGWIVFLLLMYLMTVRT